VSPPFSTIGTRAVTVSYLVTHIIALTAFPVVTFTAGATA
jgi:hypothetical protein